MTLILAALLIAGNHIAWYWFIGTVVLDVLWMSIKLNFLTVLIRRAIAEASYIEEARRAAAENPPPPPPAG